MVHEHDFRAFPELTNNQAQTHYFDSPHKQIFDDFTCTVERVIDGDTVSVLWQERDFSFPVRFLKSAAKELKEGGEDAKSWLEQRIEGEEVMVNIDKKNRVGKFGRLLGEVHHTGMDVADEMITLGLARPFNQRGEGLVQDEVRIGFNASKF
tara:strand:+ start:2453 stop:2908 length:456 start_codon:yes stop_codon:yes gene_type:complete